MEHLTDDLAIESGILTETQALAWIQEQGMTIHTNADLLHRTQRVALASKMNPGMINPELKSHER
jgi:hypothetical protein